MKKHCTTDGLRDAEGKPLKAHNQKTCSLWQRITGWFRSLFKGRTSLLLLVGWLAVGTFAASASAQSKEPLTIALTSQRVLMSGGKEALVAAEKAQPGDVIQYAASYRNTSTRPLRDVQPLLPIPAGMQYVADSAHPAPAQASLDGRTFQSIPLKRSVRAADGSMHEEVVPASEYRALRWSPRELAVGETLTLTSRVSVTASSLTTFRK